MTVTPFTTSPNPERGRLVQVGISPAGDVLARYAQQSGFVVSKLMKRKQTPSPAWDDQKQIVLFDDDNFHHVLSEISNGAEVLVWDDCYGRLGWLPDDAPAVPFVVELRGSNRQPGPWSEATLLAESGFAYLTGHRDGPPLPLPGGQAALLTGIHGWMALAASLWRHTTGRNGETNVHLILAAIETLATYHQFTLVDYAYNRRIRPRSGRRWANNHPICTYPCNDGYVAVCTATDDQFARFALILDEPELTLDPRFQTSTLRRENADQLDAVVTPKLLTLTRREISEIAGANAVPVAPVLDPNEVLAWPLSEERGLWRNASGIRLPELPRVTRHCSVQDVLDHRPLHNSTQMKPLSGIRVIEFSKVWAGPLLGRLLADLGADVVRIEAPFGRGPRHIPAGSSIKPAVYPHDEPGERPWNRQGIQNILNRNKRCMDVDIKHPKGLELAEHLCLKADIVFENNLPGALERAGLGYDRLCERNPGLIYASLSGYGQGNSLSHYPAYGPATEGPAGLTWWIRDKRNPEEPLPTAIGYPDVAIATVGAASILLALLNRERNRVGGFLDISQIDTTVFMLTELLESWQSAARVNRAPSLADNPAHVLFVERDSSWCFVANQDLSRAVAVATRRARHSPSPCPSCPPALSDAARVLSHCVQDIGSSDDMMRLLRINGIDCALARDARQIFESPELSRFWIWIDNPDIGRYRYDNSAFVFNGQRNIPHSLPGMGEHNRVVGHEWLGLTENELDELEATGAMLYKPPERRG